MESKFCEKVTCQIVMKIGFGVCNENRALGAFRGQKKPTWCRWVCAVVAVTNGYCFDGDVPYAL